MRRRNWKSKVAFCSIQACKFTPKPSNLNVARYSKILPHHVLYILSKCLSTRSNNHNASGVSSMGIPWRIRRICVSNSRNGEPVARIHHWSTWSIWFSRTRMWGPTGSKHKLNTKRLRILPAIYSSVFLEIISATHLAKDSRGPEHKGKLWSKHMIPAKTMSRSSFSDSSSEAGLQSSKYVQWSCSIKWGRSYRHFLRVTMGMIAYTSIIEIHTIWILLVIWVSQLQANTVDASRVNSPTSKHTSTLSVSWGYVRWCGTKQNAGTWT